MVILLDRFNHLGVNNLLLSFPLFQLPHFRLEKFNFLSQKSFFSIPVTFLFSDLLLEIVLHLLNNLLHVFLPCVRPVQWIAVEIVVRRQRPVALGAS